MLRQYSILLLLLFVLFGCVDNDDKRFMAKCVEGETKEIYAGTGIISYTDIISGQQGSEFHYVVINHNIDGVTLPLIICNPNDFEILQPNIRDLEVSFQGILQILPETIDAGNTTFQIEAIRTL